MIVVQLQGGLGNQMFQYAAGVSLAKRLETKVYIDLGWLNGQDKLGVITKRNYELGIFNIKPMFKNPITSLRLRLNPPTVFRDPDIRYRPEFEELKGNVVLEGFWLSPKYFKDAEEEIHRMFTFKDTLSTNSQKFLKEIEGSASVSVHVRRGDYANDPQTKKFHGLQPLSYFEKAARQIRKKVSEPRFFVFSDDPKWCQKNLKLGGPTTFVTGNAGAKSYEDMQLMAACKHNIIVNSSFSWWGSWLNPNKDKIVIAPKKWWKDKSIDSSDVVPKNWLRI